MYWVVLGGPPTRAGRRRQAALWRADFTGMLRFPDGCPSVPRDIM